MFVNHNINILKEKTKKFYIVMNIVVLFFSLNFNSLLFVPNIANAIWDEVINNQEIQTAQETPAPVVEVIPELVVEVTPEPVVVDTPQVETVVPVVETPNTSSVDTGISVADFFWNGGLESTGTIPTPPQPSIPSTPTMPDIGVDTNILTGVGTLPVVDTIPVDSTHDAANTQTPTENLTWAQSTGDQYIDDGYFTTAFTKWSYDLKILDLQNILKKLTMFSGQINGVYDDATIESVYQYQISKNLIDPAKDDASLRWFFGPKTRTAFNQEYVTYKQNLLNGINQIVHSTNVGWSVAYSKDAYIAYMEKIKSYFLDNQYSLENIFGSWVFVGNNDIDFSLLSGKIDLPLIFQSTNTLDGNMAEVTFTQGTVLKTENGDVFTWNLASPEFLDPSIANELTGQKIVSVLDVGGNDENKIFLENGSGGETSSKIKMPAPGQTEWALMTVNYSNDGITWFSMDAQKVFLEDGEPYIEFETTHFTIFSIGLPIGSFFINNDIFTTNTTAVTLNANVSGATHMRFANTGTSLTSASWVTYATGYSWWLTSANGTKTVFAEFSGAYGKQTIQDSILLDTTATGANLKFSLNGSMNGTSITDSSSNANNFTGMWGITNPIITWWEQVLSFNWTSQYAERTGINLTAYPFTFSVWVNTSRLNATQSILHIGNSGSTTVYYGLEISSTWVPAIVARNTTSYVGTSNEKLYTWQWYHIVGVFTSATSRILYVNGDQRAANTSSVLYSANTNPQLRVGRYVGTTTNYFSGQMDEVRLYNKALTVYEIRNLYNARIKDAPPIQYINDGEFTINSGESNTYKTGVTLISNVTWMTHMRFANDTWALTSAPWVSYNGTYSRYLSGSTGNNIVYAQFSWAGGIRDAQDNIFLDSAIDANLKVLLDSSMNGTNILDVTNNANNFSGVWTPTSVILSWERTLSFNGTTQYAQKNATVISAYPFTLSAWVNTDTIAWTDAIIMLGNSGTTTTYYGLQLVAWAPSIVARNTTAVITQSTRIVNTGQRYHIVWVFNSSTNRTLYVNGELTATSATTAATFVTTNEQIRVWRYVAIATNYFDGYIDDTRIYDKALSAAEIKTLYTNRTSRVSIPKASIIYSTTWSTSGPVIATLTWFSENGTTILNNSWSNTYTFTGNGSFTFMFKDVDGNIWSTIAYVDWITPAAGTLSISWPPSFTFGSTTVSTSTNSVEKAYTWWSEYFQVADNLWADAWYYTTLAVSSLQYNSSTISNNNIFVKTVGGISLLAGTANTNVVTSIGTTYTNAASPLTFIMRSAWANGGKTGTYWAQISIRVDIPAFQTAWTYTWNIIYTIY